MSKCAWSFTLFKASKSQRRWIKIENGVMSSHYNKRLSLKSKSDTELTRNFNSSDIRLTKQDVGNGTLRVPLFRRHKNNVTNAIIKSSCYQTYFTSFETPATIRTSLTPFWSSTLMFTMKKIFGLDVSFPNIETDEGTQTFDSRIFGSNTPL